MSSYASCDLPMEMRFQLFGEIFTTITMLDGLTITEVDGLNQSQYEHVFKKKLIFVKYLRTIGEAGTVKITNDTTPKLQDCGIHCILLGMWKIIWRAVIGCMTQQHTECVNHAMWCGYIGCSTRNATITLS